MPTRIFHTADVHLGMKFARPGYNGELQEKLVEARYEVLGKMVDVANKKECDIFVVAGDLFDSVRAPKKLVRRAAEILNTFKGGAVLVLPGNHDYFHDGGGLWEDFQQAMGDHVVVLSQCKPLDLTSHGLDVVVYPGPCTDKHSQEHAIGWLKDQEFGSPERLRIGIAHGSLRGVSYDRQGNYYPMTEAELRDTGMHLWLLGHSHLRYPNVNEGDSATIFYPSTPEPDGFDCEHSGYAWLIDASDDNEITYQSLQTGSYQFKDLNVTLSNEHDVEKLKKDFRKLDRSVHLVKLTLVGRLPGHLVDELKNILAELEAQVLYLETHWGGLQREITKEDINREFTQGSFPHRLLLGLAEEQENALAVQIAHELIQEAKA